MHKNSKTKTFKHAIISTEAFANVDILTQALTKFIPSAHAQGVSILKTSCFPQTGTGLPKDVKHYQKLKNSDNPIDQRSGREYLSIIGPNYELLAEKATCVLLLPQNFLTVGWLDILKRYQQGIIFYTTDGFLARSSHAPLNYRFSTWENGRLNPRGVFQVRTGWLSTPELKPIKSWKIETT